MSNTPFLTCIADQVAEAVTTQITGMLTDETGTALAGSSLTGLTLTLYVKGSGAILNSRSAVDVLNVNGGSVSEDGLLTMVLDPADNALNVQRQDGEVHVAQFVWTYNNGDANGKALVEFTVADFPKV